MQLRLPAIFCLTLTFFALACGTNSAHPGGDVHSNARTSATESLADEESAHASKPDGLSVEIEASRVLSLFYFMQSAAREPHTCEHLRELYVEHRDELQANPVELYRLALATVPDRLSYEYPGDTSPKARHSGVGYRSLLEMRAARSTDLADFARRITGLMPIDGQSNLLQALRQLEPLHDKYVWEPGAELVTKTKAQLEALAKTRDLEGQLDRAATFYGVDWPEQLPVNVYLVPVPNFEKGATHAHSAGSMQVMEVVPNDDLADRYAVLVHEICHTFYAAQSGAMQADFESWFLDHDSPGSPYAYRQINEALATAIGNGYIEILSKGDTHKQASWYNDPIIDAYGKALLPLVRRYLEDEKPLDRSFVDGAVSTFDKRFPNSERSPALMFHSMAIFVGGALDLDLARSHLRGAFRVHSLYSSQPIGHKFSQASFRNTGDVPALFVLRADDRSALDGYPVPPHALQAIEQGFEGPGPFAYTIQAGERRLVFVGVDDDADLAPAFERLGDTDVLPEAELVRLGFIE